MGGGKGLHSLHLSKFVEERVQLDADLLEETFVTAPAAIAHSAGRVGNGCILGTNCSQPPIFECRACINWLVLNCSGAEKVSNRYN